MSFFYLKHHFLSIVRSKSFGGEVIAFVLLFVFTMRLIPMASSSIDSYVEILSNYLELPEANFKIFLLAYFFSDLALKLSFKRPSPKMKYYLLWTNKISHISWQYLITSLFGIIPFFMLASFVPIFSKTIEWLGSDYVLIVTGLWFSTFFLGLFFQYSTSKVRTSFLTIPGAFAVLIIFNVVPILSFANCIFNPITVFLLLIITITGSFYSVRNYLKKRIVERSSKFQLALGRSWINFKNPLFQLEWALITRNKRTRSNLMMGVFAVVAVPWYLTESSSEIVVLVISLISTGFFIIQHGVYSLGWEGSYFDFLLTNISLKNFISSRYKFYVWTCLFGFSFGLIPTLVNGLDGTILVSLLFYNIGITIPLVLYRSVFNSSKIELSESSFMNYNGMLTGPIMVTSLLVILVPFALYGLSQRFLGEYTVHGLGIIGLIGFALNSFFVKRIVAFLSQKKYHLSQSFKS